MKKEHFLRGIMLYYIFALQFYTYGQSRGDLAFTAFNGDSDDDFSITTLIDIPINATFYFTDKSFDAAANNGNGGFDSGEGTITWETGGSIIKAGTIIVFSDIDSASNPNYGVSIGSITTSGSFNMTTSTGGDSILVFIGTNKETPTTFITGIKNASLTINELLGTKLNQSTDLTPGVDFLEFNPSANPDGGYFNNVRNNQASYNNYLSLLVDKSKWTSIVNGDGNTFLPFSEESFTIHSTTWNGTTSTVWNSTSNWSNGIPTSDSNAIIPLVGTKPSIESPATSGNIQIAASSALTNNSDLTIKGMILINSGASLISNNPIIGKISYQRLLTANWHLVSSPLASQNILEFTKHSSNTNSIASNSLKYAIAPYDNESGKWSYYTPATIESANSFVSGKGYSVLRADAGQIRFVGNYPSNIISHAITEGTSNRWNLIGNPFPSYIPANFNANATTNFIQMNTSKLDASYQALYFWNGTEYDVINQATTSRHIAPGQGFFVYSKTGGATVQFTKEMQSHQTNDIFNKTKKTNPSITIKATDGNQQSTTKIKYISNSTTGLDPGYDAGKFNGFKNSFGIHTRLVSNDKGIPLFLQTLPTSNYENMAIPLEITTDEMKEVTVEFECLNLPQNLMVFLLDKYNKTIDRLDKAGSFSKKFIHVNDENRFIIRTTFTDLSKTLSLEHDTFSKLKIFQHKNHIILKGVSTDITVQLFDVQGKEQKIHLINSKDFMKLNTSQVRQGIYIIRIHHNGKMLHKKILLLKQY